MYPRQGRRADLAGRRPRRAVFGAPVRPAVAAALAGSLLLAGCSAEPRPAPPTRAPSPATVQVPADGVTLKQLGFTNGPADAFSLPRTSAIITSVDQPSGVTVVLSRPDPGELTAYLYRVLPETGFLITRADPAATTLVFTGFGWHGTFTGAGDTSAVILRP